MPALRSAAVEVEVAVLDPVWREALPRARSLARRAAEAALAAAAADRDRPRRVPRRCALAIALADDATVRPLNRRWRGKDRPTNVLSFPSGELDAPSATRRRGEPVQIGDVILARETVRREAEAQGKPMAHHLMHLVAHGVLHLIGYDHETGPDDAEHMEGVERALLALLQVPDPY